MKEMKYTLGLVFINLLCSILNYIQAVMDFNQIAFNQSDFMLHMICAILWTIAAVMNLIRYLKQGGVYNE